MPTAVLPVLSISDRFYRNVVEGVVFLVLLLLVTRVNDGQYYQGNSRRF